MLRRPAVVLASLAVAVVALDQLSKAVVRSELSPVGRSVPVIGDLVRFTHTRNTGAAFGMLPGNRFIFIGVSLVVLVGIVAYLWRWRPTRAWTVSALGLVAGGATGNLIDRTVRGYVTDFVQVPFDFPVFNLADSAIVVGVAMLVWWLLFGPTPDQSVADAQPENGDAVPLPAAGPDVATLGDGSARGA